MPGIGDLLAQLLVQKAPDILKGLNEAQVQPQQMTQATMSQAPAESRSSAVSPGVGSALQTAREAALKGLKKITEQQIAEAATVMPTEQLAQQIDTVMPDQTQLNQALAGGGQFALPGPETVQPRNFNQSQSVAPQQPQAQPAVVNPEGLLQNLFQRMGFNDQGQFQSGGFLAKTFDNLSQASGGPGIVDQLLKVQELTGQQPLQQGEREKIGLELGKSMQLEILKQTQELAKSGRLKPNELFDKFEAASKPFTEVRDGFSRIQTAFDNRDTISPDLDLLFGTAKTLDPSGRVTDADIAIQQLATGAYGDSLRRIAKKFTRDGFLTEAQRRMLFNAGKNRFKAMERQQKNTTEEFVILARNNKLDPSNLFRDVGLAQENQQRPQTFVSVQDAEDANLPPGTQIIINGRRAVIE